MIEVYQAAAAMNVTQYNDGLNQLFAALTTLLEDNEYDNTFLKPTTYAIEQLRTWLIQVEQGISRILPDGHVATDGAGGLRIEWSANNKEIRLIVPATKNEAAFIYYQAGASYGVEPGVSADTLTKWLSWLCN